MELEQFITSHWQALCLLLAALVLAISAVQVLNEFHVSSRFSVYSRVFGYGISGLMLMSSVAIGVLALAVPF